jgi:type I restriction enzyme M protein
VIFNKLNGLHKHTTSATTRVIDYSFVRFNQFGNEIDYGFWGVKFAFLNMVSKLSENGVAGFILANGALSGGGEEYKIRKKLVGNDLVEAIIIIPRNTFYTTDISVTLWILNKNKKARTSPTHTNDKDKNYRNREKEILFMDLRRWGNEYEKKYVQLTKQDIEKVALNYHNWQQISYETTYKNIPD